MRLAVVRNEFGILKSSSGVQMTIEYPVPVLTKGLLPALVAGTKPWALIFSPFRACAVAMFPSRKHSNCRGMKWRWNKGKEAAALGFFLVQQPFFVDVPCEPHRIEIVR
jgi:hypothetical protein